MQREIALGNRNIEYTLRKNSLVRSVRLAVRPGGAVVVTVPHFLGASVAEKFIREKADWLVKKIDYLKQFEPRQHKKSARRDYLKYKEEARAALAQKTEHFSNAFGFKFNKISIRDQKTCWGSCTKKGNLNFNYKILFLPQKIQDYIVVHELCHLRELNHSKNFWGLVALAVPDYALIKKELSKIKAGNAMF